MQSAVTRADTDPVGDFDDFWLTHPNPTDEDILGFCRAWADYQRDTEHTHVGVEHPGWWGVEAVMDAEVNGGLPMLWRMIRCLCSVVSPDDEHIVAMIGIGPIENAFFSYGERAMDLIEPAAEFDPVLLTALQSVWLLGFARSAADRRAARQTWAWPRSVAPPTLDNACYVNLAIAPDPPGCPLPVFERGPDAARDGRGGPARGPCA